MSQSTTVIKEEAERKNPDETAELESNVNNSNEDDEKSLDEIIEAYSG